MSRPDGDHPIAQFTPGPWRLNGSQAQEQVACGEAGNGYVVAQAMGYTHSSHGEAEANARLIAAAPELYEALKGLVTYAEAVRHTAGMGKNQLARLEAAKAALAKVRGSQ